MFDDIPENYRAQTADNEEEGWRYTQGDKNARRPPELLTRDHVAAASCARSRQGRGSPHGGVFLDIAWIKEQLPNAAEHIKKKLPSMYHQFKQLADIDITSEPMEVGPTTHYIMGGVRVDADTQMSNVPGPVRRRRVRRRHQRREPARRQLAVGPARVRQARRRVRREVRDGQQPARSIDARQVDEAARQALEPFERGADGEGPYQVQYELQEMMQDLVGIVRNEDEMQRALDGLAQLRERAAQRRRRRQSRVQPRLAHRARSAQPADRLRSDHALGDRAQGKPRRPLPRGLSRTRTPSFGKFNIVVRKGRDGGDGGVARRRSRRCRTS